MQDATIKALACNEVIEKYVIDERAKKLML